MDMEVRAGGTLTITEDCSRGPEGGLVGAGTEPWVEEVARALASPSCVGALGRVSALREDAPAAEGEVTICGECAGTGGPWWCTGESRVGAASGARCWKRDNGTCTRGEDTSALPAYWWPG